MYKHKKFLQITYLDLVISIYILSLSCFIHKGFKSALHTMMEGLIFLAGVVSEVDFNAF